VLWIHGASVGESLSALPLIDRLLELNPDLHILVTSGTVTSANLLAQKLPPRAFHQYIPLDVPAYARRFLAYWRPYTTLWLESELWPNLLAAVKHEKIPAARLNARLTAKSARGWLNHKKWFRHIHQAFEQTLVIAKADAQRLAELGVNPVLEAGNLKLTTPMPMADERASIELSAKIGGRPVWLFANTHPGEDELAVRIHQQLAAQIPDLLTLIVPRHTARADAIAAQLGPHVPRRSRGEWPRAEHGFYLGDSMGEMGLYYKAAGIVCVGGSFTPKGGHNPVEPAQCGCAVLIGPDTSKCEDLTELLMQAGALQKVHTESELIEQLRTLLQDTQARTHAQNAARLATNSQAVVMHSILTALAPTLNKAGIACT
jgi:3-deoxy-D-manno-octulosonic-acid transferase